MGVDDFNIGIGARKAKKLGPVQVLPQESSSENGLENKSIIELRNDIAQKSQTALAPSVSSDSAPAKAGDSLSREEIIQLAQKHGLKFEGMKREFVKHTYSVTTDSKALFKKYCDTLAMNMQDAMEESLQDFFKKHALEYNRVSEAKRK